MAAEHQTFLGEGLPNALRKAFTVAFRRPAGRPSERLSEGFSEWANMLRNHYGPGDGPGGCKFANWGRPGRPEIRQALRALLGFCLLWLLCLRCALALRPCAALRPPGAAAPHLGTPRKPLCAYFRFLGSASSAWFLLALVAKKPLRGAWAAPAKKSPPGEPGQVRQEEFRGPREPCVERQKGPQDE